MLERVLMHTKRASWKDFEIRNMSTIMVF